MELTTADRAMLEGRAGAAAGTAMRILVQYAEAIGAPRLLDVVSAHIDGCLYHGVAGLDWATLLVDQGARVAVPTTLNVSSLDLLHPDLYRGDAETRAQARGLMDAYLTMGCRPTWTCAPYQLPERPSFGEHVAWAESNAIVFANSVLGARTDRYGDFIDICAAITGRAPDAGLHRTVNRRPRLLLSLRGGPGRLIDSDVFYPVLGHVLGRLAGSGVAAIEGLPSGTSEDRLKALGAAAASSGAVALFHAIGVTPEAPTRESLFGETDPDREIEIGMRELVDARDSLSTTSGGELATVSLGTPHASEAEIAEVVSLLGDARVHPRVDFYLSTGRDVLEAARSAGHAEALRRAGVQIVTDTCTYITPILRTTDGVAMTNSAKWAYYAPGNVGVDVVFGSTLECVRSAVEGRVWRDESLWSES